MDKTQVQDILYTTLRSISIVQQIFPSALVTILHEINTFLDVK